MLRLVRALKLRTTAHDTNGRQCATKHISPRTKKQLSVAGVLSTVTEARVKRQRSDNGEKHRRTPMDVEISWIHTFYL